MMENILTYRVTPVLKCVVLFLFIFTAKVLTTRPQETDSSRNSIHHVKPSHYVRSFTKYHHRRTTQWNGDPKESYWPVTQDQPRVIAKRSLDIPNSNKFIGSDEIVNFHEWNGDPKESYWPVSQDQPKVIAKRSLNIPNSISSKEIVDLHEFSPDSSKDNTVGSFDKKVDKSETKHGFTYERKRNKDKVAIEFKEPQTTVGTGIKCLYKINNVAMSVTPSYDDDKNSQLMVENDSYDFPVTLSETTLSSGETVQVQECTDPKASCYTLFHHDDGGNITVLGQGCWRASQKEGRGMCEQCIHTTRRLPRSKFCCCSTSFCNADFTSLKDEIITPRAASTVDTTSQTQNNFNIIASSVLALVAVLILALLFRRLYCKKLNVNKEVIGEGMDVEKGDVMGSGPDALATGLLCVDNITLIEHIGQGKFGSVWRGSLGSNPVAVKLYSNANTWQKEAAIYSLPHLSHSNILKYYGSDTRPILTSGCGREHLVVLELCSMSLRTRLQQSPLSWRQFANIAHGLASALAHLHTQTPTKPCIVHRDVNSNNVLVTEDGHARLADLGLAQVLLPRQDNTQPSRITEAGTMRYLAPEALEGALDLSGARAALCAVDVFALALVIWEALWRCAGAHPGRTPAYALPYSHHKLPPNPTLAQMQSLVSRNKARPPLPTGPSNEPRALRLAVDTCDECWDHDAEARLTAVCVEERMSELQQMVSVQPPLIHDNNLHPHQQPPTQDTTALEIDKNSNCTAIQCDNDAETRARIGRNACIERNTHTATLLPPCHLVHKSLKDVSASPPPPPQTQSASRLQNIDYCLSVARAHPRPPDVSDRTDIRSYQRPLEYVPNDVTAQNDRPPKETNLQNQKEKPKWTIRKFFEKKLAKNSKVLETEVKLIPEPGQQQNKTRTSLVNEKTCNFDRPSNLVLTERFNFEPCTLSPPNRTLSPTMMLESENRSDKIFGFKEIPILENEAKTNQIFAVIVPKAKPVEMKQDSSDSITKSIRTSMSSQSIFKSGNSESEDSTLKKRLSCDNRIITNVSNSGRSSRASINLELQYLENKSDFDSPYDLNSDCSSSEDEHLMLLSENGGSKITMQAIPKDAKRNEVLKESGQTKTDFVFNKQNKYTNFDNEFSDPNDKENLLNGYLSGDNPVYLAAFKGEIVTEMPKSPKPCLKNVYIKRQRSLEQVSELFSSSGDVHLQNPAGRVKTPGDLPVAVRRARRDKALQKGRANECNRLSLYDDRMMFGNSL